jgi:hypothetical protein
MSKDFDSIHDHLRAAWRSTDVSRLAALATIVWGCTENIDLRRVSSLALAIARTLEHTNESLESFLVSALDGSSTSDRQQLAAIVGDAIQHHPASAAELACLISEIVKP